MRLTRLIAPLILLASVVTSVGAIAQEVGQDVVGGAAGPDRSDHVRVNLVAEHTSVQPGGAVLAGLRLRLDPGWHVYWKNPGDAGMEVSIEWEASEDVTPGEIRWPAPHRFVLPGPIVSFGYEDDVLLLVPVRVAKTAKKHVTLRGRVTWLVCKDLCIDGSQQVEITLPVSTSKPEPHDPCATLFAASRAALPMPVVPGTLSASRSTGHVSLEVGRLGAPERADLEWDFFEDSEALVTSAAPSVEGSTLRLKHAARGSAPDRLRGVVVWSYPGRRRAFVVDVPAPRARDEQRSGD